MWGKMSCRCDSLATLEGKKNEGEKKNDYSTRPHGASSPGPLEFRPSVPTETQRAVRTTHTAQQQNYQLLCFAEQLTKYHGIHAMHDNQNSRKSPKPR